MPHSLLWGGSLKIYILQQLIISDNLDTISFKVFLFILPIFLIINSLSSFSTFSTFTQHKAVRFPSSKLLLVKLIVYLSLEMFEVTPTTITSSESLLNSLLLITMTGLTFFPDWSENGKGTNNRSPC